MSKGDIVMHKIKKWRGHIVGCGFGRKPERWNNPDVYYVDWFRRKPNCEPIKPELLEGKPK